MHSLQWRLCSTTKLALTQLESAVAASRLSPAAAHNIRTWLSEPYLAEYAPQVAEHLAAGKWKELDDAFWTIIPFGTGGRRGKMYPIGTNAINDRTIGESAQGLADYVREEGEKGQKGKKDAGGKLLACAIAYDTRHRSREFAELCAASWRRPDSRSISSTASAARRNSLSPCVTRNAIAA